MPTSTNTLPRAATLGLLLASLGLAAGASGQTSFTDVTAAAGLGAAHTSVTETFTSSGAAVGDFDADGWQDILMQNGVFATNTLYMNDGDGTFTDRAPAWGVAETFAGDGSTVGDYDNDGWLDVYVQSRGPWPLAPGHNRLYRNLGGQAFVDRAPQAGVSFTSPLEGDGFSPCFGDIDLDGDLDLFTTGWELEAGTNQLFRNEGDGSFTNITASHIAVDLLPVRGMGPEFVDMDGDRFPELLITADFGTSLYLANNGDGTFSDLTQESGWTHYAYGMGTAVGDFDGNGWLDCYVSSIFFDDGLPPGEGNLLYLSDGPDAGPHRFSEQNEAWGCADNGFSWGLVALDMDQDGWIDIVANNGWDNVAEFTDERMHAFHNQAGTGFVEVGPAVGLDVVIDGRGLARLDHDNDGDLDVLVSGRGAVTRLLRNDLVHDASHHGLRVFLDSAGQPGLAPHGYQSSVVLQSAGRRQRRSLGSGGSVLSANELSAHFGLGSEASAERLEVHWADGHITTWLDVPADQTLSVSCCGAWVDLGSSTATSGSYDPPRLVAVGELVGGQPVSLLLDDARPGAPAWMVLGLAAWSLPFKGGLLVPDLSQGLLLPLGTDAQGSAVATATWPLGAPAQAQLWAQAWIQDPQGPVGLTASNALRGTAP